jgi:putative phosphoribosyl transferase
MTDRTTAKIVDTAELREQVRLFDDRRAAGEMIADILAGQLGSDPLILGIAAGGVEVAAPIAKRLGVGLNVAVVNKITPPWNTEWGFGAVAYDGSVVINESSLAQAGIDQIELGQCTGRARDKVNHRLELFGRYGPPEDMSGRTVVVVDDGLATGITMRGAIGAVKRGGAGEIVMAIPTAHCNSIDWFANRHTVGSIYCPNIRSGPSFAVAQAYKNWTNMTDAEIEAVMAEFPIVGEYRGQ